MEIETHHRARDVRWNPTAGKELRFVARRRVERMNAAAAVGHDAAFRSILGRWTQQSSMRLQTASCASTTRPSAFIDTGVLAPCASVSRGLFLHIAAGCQSFVARAFLRVDLIVCQFGRDGEYGYNFAPGQKPSFHKRIDFHDFVLC